MTVLPSFLLSPFTSIGELWEKTFDQQAVDPKKKQQIIKYLLWAVTGGSLYFTYRWLRNARKSKTTVSAPGKVLITGGYLVLENQYSGLVLGSSSRFYTQVESLRAGKQSTRSFTIDLQSPQFHYQTRFHVKKLVPMSVTDQHSFEVRLERAPNASENKYIEYSLLFAIAVAQYFASGKLSLTESMTVKLLADNDFYSQRQNLRDLHKPVNLETLAELPKCYSPKEKKEIHKTGLGSSAAMVTSLVASLLVHLGVVGPKATEMKDREIIHRVAQFVHCLAQGKVGSGFDVSSATYGSQKYTRFNARALQRCLEAAETKNHHLNQCVLCDYELIRLIAEDLELDALVNYGPLSKWNNRRTPFQLPPGFFLFVADVDQGSNTPSMVRQVLQWRSDKKEKADEVWNQIDSLNNSIEQLFNELTEYSKEDMDLYMDALSTLSTVSSEQWQSIYTNKNSLGHRIADCMSRIRYTFGYIRQKLKYMGEQSGVPIEPDEQTDLLNATVSMQGCLIAGVPGAGGFDAIFCILFGNEREARSRMANMWLNYEKAVVGPLLLGESQSKGIVVE